MKQPTRLDLEQKISELKVKNDEINNRLIESEAQGATVLEQARTEFATKIAADKLEHDEEIEKLEDQISELTEDIAEKEAALHRKELKRLASAFNEQETDYKNESTFWLKCLGGLAGALVLSTLLSIWISSDKVWYDKFEYYLIDFILISAVWFCSSQYSNLIKLRNDYANRKTIAQSFHNILDNLEEDESIKDKFIEKATDVLCAPSFLIDKEPILTKKIVKDTLELAKAAKA